ncbi:MAG: hypothetical protein P8X68_22805 [Desulfobacterales bacterium]
MIRSNEITYLVFDDIDKSLSKKGYDDIKIAEDKIYFLIEAKKSFYGYFFVVNIEYNDITKIVQIIVQTSTPVPKEKQIFCLKLLNYINLYDEEEKYILRPFNHSISCSTVFSILDSGCSIGESLEFSASMAILNLVNIYETIKYDDVRICDLNPIRFHNYL